MNLSSELRTILQRAQSEAADRRHAFADCEHVLAEVLTHLGEPAAAACVCEELDRLPDLPFAPAEAEHSRGLVGRALPAALQIALGEGSDSVQPEHLLAALLGSSSPISEPLRKRVQQRVTSVSLPTAWARTKRSLTAETVPAESKEPVSGNIAPMGSWLKPVLSDEHGSHLVARPEQQDRILQALLFGSPLLVGPPGSGRRSLLRLVTSQLQQKRVPPPLASAELWELDPLEIVAGTSYRGELEERISKLVQVLRARPNPVVLLVQDLGGLLGRGPSGGADVASALVPLLKSRNVHILTTATRDVVRERLETIQALLESFVVVAVDPATRSESVRLLSEMPGAMHSSYAVALSHETIEQSVSICVQHLPQHALPGVAERLLRDACATLFFESAMLQDDPTRIERDYWRDVACSSDKYLAVGRRHVLHALSQAHRIPFEHLDSGTKEKIRGLADAFAQQIFGQDHVLDVIERPLKVALTDLSDPIRPRGRLFFLGPPGTGKTECARLLTRYLLGSDSALLRFDMSEFQTEASVSTLLGSDKGLVGSDEGGRLTEPLLENPHRVVLFDEIEKAHPAVFNMLLPALDFGEIKDKKGRRVSFRNSICIFTSNAGCTATEGLFGKSRPEIVERLEDVFRPEFLNRIEYFVAFRPLEVEARRKVVDYQLERVRQQLREMANVELRWQGSVLDGAAQLPQGESGARNILRWIEGEVKPGIADALLDDSRTRGRLLELRTADDGGLEPVWLEEDGVPYVAGDEVIDAATVRS